MNIEEYEARNSKRNILFKKKLLGEFDFIDRKRKVEGNRNYFSSIRLNTDMSPRQTESSTKI